MPRQSSCALAPRDRLIVALDTPTVAEARALVTTLGTSVSFYKIGLELVMNGGFDLARGLIADGKRVFLDMKLLDIANTVERATANAAALGVTFLTVHGTDTKTLAAAVKGRGKSPLKLMAVTVLTSLEQADLTEQGIAQTPAGLVMHRARLAQAAGFDGVIASGQEAASLRASVRKDFLVVTPGIRLADGTAGDQARVTTPAQAIANGADYLVVGRPITEAKNPQAAAELVVADMIAGR
jgi:orotidine-5'-phosphate decarboxylase